jgi:hypothetical protein
MVIHIDEEKSRWGGILRDFVSRNTVAEAPELGADFKRNQLSISNGMGWRLAPEYTIISIVRKSGLPICVGAAAQTV